MQKGLLESLPKVCCSAWKQFLTKLIFTVPVTVRLTPLLKTDVAVVQFPDVRTATVAVKDILNKGVGIRKSSQHSVTSISLPTPFAECIELLDDQAMSAINAYGQSVRKWAAKDSLYIKFQGSTESSISESIKLTKEIAKRHGAVSFNAAKDQKEAEALWADRKNVLFAGLARAPGCKSWPTDVWWVSHESQQDLVLIGIQRPSFETARVGL